MSGVEHEGCPYLATEHTGGWFCNKCGQSGAVETKVTAAQSEDAQLRAEIATLRAKLAEAEAENEWWRSPDPIAADDPRMKSNMEEAQRLIDATGGDLIIASLLDNVPILREENERLRKRVTYLLERIVDIQVPRDQEIKALRQRAEQAEQRVAELRSRLGTLPAAFEAVEKSRDDERERNKVLAEDRDQARRERDEAERCLERSGHTRSADGKTWKPPLGNLPDYVVATQRDEARRERDEAREKAKNQAREIRTMQEVAERKNAIINELRGGPAERLPEGVTYAVMRKDILRLTKQREAVVEAARALVDSIDATGWDQRPNETDQLRAALAEIEEPKPWQKCRGILKPDTPEFGEDHED